MPEDLIYDAVNAGDYLLQVIGSSTFVTAQGLKKLVQMHQETFRKSDNTWWLEEDFLLGGAHDKAIDTHLKSRLVAILPDFGEDRVFAKGVMAMRQLISGEVVLAQDIALQNKMQSAVNMMQNVMEANGPTAKEASKLSEFAQRLLKRAEN